MEYFYRTVNKSVGAGMNTLMSISDGLGPSIFCRKMEKARPMREEMDGKVVYFPPESALFDAILFDSTFPYLCFDLACKQLCFPPGKNINRRNESTTSERWRAVWNFFGTCQSLSREHSRNLSRAFQNLLETLNICTKLTSEQVLTIFSQSSFILHLIFIYFTFS